MCQLSLIYVATLVSENNWYQNGATNTVGIIGMGPTSTLWEPYQNSTTLTATYSISLARTAVPVTAQRNLQAVGASSTESSITLGYANTSSYVNSSSLVISTSSDYNYTYILSSFSFGVVYLD